MPISSIEGICNMALGYAGVGTRITSIDEASAAAQACKVYYEQYRDDMLQEYRWDFAKRRVALVPYAGVPYLAAQVFGLNDLILYGAFVYRSLLAGNVGNQPDISPGWWAQVTRDGWAYCCPAPADLIDPIEVYPAPGVSATGTPSVFASPPPNPLRNPRSEQRNPFEVEDANDGSGGQVILTDIPNPVLHYVAQITNPMSYPSPFIKALAWELSVPLCLKLRQDVMAAKALEMKAEKETRESIASEMRDDRDDPEPVSEFEAARES